MQTALRAVMAKPKSKSKKSGARKGASPSPYDVLTTDARRARTHVIEAENKAGKVVAMDLGAGLEEVDVEITKGGLVITRTVRNTFESPLDELFAAGVLDDKDPSIKARRFAAGQDFRHLYEKAGRRGRETASYERDPVRSQLVPMPDHVAKAWAKYCRILKALTEDEARVAADVCCRLERVSSKYAQTLRNALDKLADEFYGSDTKHLGTIRRPQLWSAPAKYDLIVIGGPVNVPMFRMENILEQVSRSFQVGHVRVWDTPGICEQAKAWAESKRIPVTVHDAESGSAKRNRIMLACVPREDEEAMGIIVAFPGGGATDQMVELAEDIGISILEVDY